MTMTNSLGTKNKLSPSGLKHSNKARKKISSQTCRNYIPRLTNQFFNTISVIKGYWI